MPSILWVNDNGTTTVVEVDDEGNRIDVPEVKPEPAPVAPRKPGRPRKQR